MQLLVHSISSFNDDELLTIGRRLAVFFNEMETCHCILAHSLLISVTEYLSLWWSHYKHHSIFLACAFEVVDIVLCVYFYFLRKNRSIELLTKWLDWNQVPRLTLGSFVDFLQGLILICLLFWKLLFNYFVLKLIDEPK